MEIAILLATYNSERFLQEQLDSLFKQTYKEFYIYIRDDGSTDSTIQIINSYCEIYPNIKLLYDPIKHLCSAGSFMWLLEHVHADYYMFCDHDDIWLPDKIQLTLQKMLLTECTYHDKPVLIHTDLQVVDKNLQMIHPSFWKRTKILPQILKKFNYIGVCNCATGCTIMINDLAKQRSLPYYKEAPMHDWWVAANVAKYGIIDYVDKITILYRQHQNNVVGARNISKAYFINRLFHLNSTIKNNRLLFPFHKAIGYGGIAKYYWYKFLYIIRRNI